MVYIIIIVFSSVDYSFLEFHYDIKPDNILIFASGLRNFGTDRAVLCDFGLAEMLKGSKTHQYASNIKGWFQLVTSRRL